MKKLFLLSLVAISGCVGAGTVARYSEAEIESVNIEQSEIVQLSGSQIPRIDLRPAIGRGEIVQSEIVDSIHFVPLETTKASIFGGISKIVLSDNLVIIKDDDGNLLVFGRDGKFKFKSKRGNGPGEINKLWDIAFDEQQQRIVAYHSDRLNFYDTDGNFISTQRCPIGFLEMMPTQWGYVFFQDQYVNLHLGREADYSVLLADKEFSVFAKGGSTCRLNLINAPQKMHQTGNSVLVSNTLNDTIYKVEGKKLKADFMIDCNSQKLAGKSEEEIKMSGDYFFNGGYLENGQTQIFTFSSFRNGGCVVVRDKKSGKVAGGNSIRNNPGEMPLIIPATCTVSNGYFVSYFYPSKGMHFSWPAISAADSEKLARLTEEDNIVLVLYKTKSF